MRFTRGLKSLFKKPLLIVIFITFLCTWAFFFIAYTNPELRIGYHIAFFYGFLQAFTFIILLMTFFIPIEKISGFILILALILVVPLGLLFGIYVEYLYLFCFYANQVIIAFFAFKFCMDSSIKIDKALYNSKHSTIFRIIEFISFLVLSVFLILFVANFLLGISPNAIPRFKKLIVSSFRIVFWILVILIIIVLIALIIMRKFASYIPLFYIFVTLYTAYIILSIWAEFRYFSNITYDIISLIIDFLLFLYIIGSIFDRVDYIHDHLKIIKADTIAVFVILMKMVIQATNVKLEMEFILNPGLYYEQVIGQAIGLFIYFIVISFIIGIFQIFIYKHKKKFKKID
ncbi:MAG: hypothetical protein ACFFAS_05950 [Promethearchaeota archaeon]